MVGGSGKLSVDTCTCTGTCTSDVALSVDVCGSAHFCGCVVNGSNAKAAFWVVHKHLYSSYTSNFIAARKCYICVQN